MLSRLSNVLWMEEGASEEQNAVAWSTAPAANSLGGTMADGREEMALPCFKSILDDGWYVEASSAGGSSSNQVFAGIHASDSADAALDFPPPADSSCFPFSVFAVDPSIQQAFFAPKPDFSSLISAVCSNPFNAGLGFTSDSPAFLSPPHSSVFLSRGAAVGDIGRVGDGVLGFPGVKICDQDLLPSPSFNPMSFDSSENSLFLNRAKVIKPLQKSPLTGVHPTLFQKRAAAALRQNSSTNGRDESMVLGISSSKAIGKVRNALEGCEPDRSGENDEEDIDEASFGGSGLNCDSEDFDITENMSLEDEKKLGFSSASVAGKGSNFYSAPTGSGEPKGRKKGLPAKNLMAERRRRKKLNDRLYLLRSVVPRISKMDRASILGDAKEYLKELLQRINGLHDELESINSSLPSSSSTSFQPSTPTPPTLPCRLKDELRSSTLPSPIGQAATVEVRLSEGRAVNIHMFCPRRPGLLLSAMRALDSFGLDIQQAVISCFNGFALDVFRAELSENGAGVLAEEIKEVLLQSAGCQSTV